MVGTSKVWLGRNGLASVGVTLPLSPPTSLVLLQLSSRDFVVVVWLGDSGPSCLGIVQGQGTLMSVIPPLYVHIISNLFLLPHWHASPYVPAQGLPKCWTLLFGGGQRHGDGTGPEKSLAVGKSLGPSKLARHSQALSLQVGKETVVDAGEEGDRAIHHQEKRP
jgi:hypothetical protein